MATPPNRTPLATILLEFALSRLLLTAVGLLALAYLPSVTGQPYHHVSGNPLIDLWSRWDTAFYVRIALSGYTWQYGPIAPTATFFPVLPALMRLPLQLFFPGEHPVEAVVIGVLLSNLALGLATVCLDALVRLDFAPAVARSVRWLIWLAPMSIFFGSVYTESLFLLFSVLAIYSARRGRWVAAGLAAFLTGLTRPVGFVVVIPLLFIAWQQASLLKRLPALLAPIAAASLYVALVGLSTGEALAYFSSGITFWRRGASLPWQAFLYYFTGPLTVFDGDTSLVDLAFTLAYLALALLAFRFSKPYGWYALALLALPILSGTLHSMPRYGAVAFPIYLVLGRWMGAHRGRQALVLAGSFLLSVLVTARFVTWHWIA